MGRATTYNVFFSSAWKKSSGKFYFSGKNTKDNKLFFIHSLKPQFIRKIKFFFGITCNVYKTRTRRYKSPAFINYGYSSRCELEGVKFLLYLFATIPFISIYKMCSRLVEPEKSQ